MTTATLTTLTLYIRFHFEQTLFLEVEADINDNPVDLSLSKLMPLLMKNEAEIGTEQSEVLYKLARFLKRVQLPDRSFLAITTETEIALFFSTIFSSNINVFWQNDTETQPLQLNAPLPISLKVTQSGRNLAIQLLNQKDWIDNPLGWLTFAGEGRQYYFSDGVLAQEICPKFESFLMQFLDQDTIRLQDAEMDDFVHTIYEPNKGLVTWQIQADFLKLLPQDVDPTPVLKITESQNQLMPTLAFRYLNTTVSDPSDEPILIDAESGYRFKRQPEMEATYQQDLMTLFQENNLPFLLTNPADMATFLESVVGELESRNWAIESEVTSFKIDTTAHDVSFSINSSGQDWFYFEPNCTVGNTKMSLQELARLMVENQGFIKTKSGYLKLSEKSQKELKSLQKAGAFGVGAKFKKQDMIGLIHQTSVTAESVTAKELVSIVNDYNRTPTTPSKAFKGTLRDYQQNGLNWLNFLHKTSFGGILADDMGLGKTVQTLAFCSQLPDKKPVLVIGPTNVIYNWKDEAAKFLPKATTLIYGGTNRHKLISKLPDQDFIIVSFGVLKNDIEVFSKLPLKAILIDEAQYIKNPKSQISKAVKTLQAPFKLAMTGTPIENHLVDLWNIFDFANPNFLGTQKQFEVDIQTERLSLVKTKMAPFILRREKQSVLTSLPEKTEIIRKCDLTDAQETLYQTVLSAAKSGIKTASGQAKRLHVLASLLKLRQVCLHPNLIEESQHLNIESSKWTMAQNTLSELVDEGHKVVVFTQFTKMLDIMAKWLADLNIYTERIDGSVTGKRRQAATHRFQTHDGAGVFIISLKAGGVGINLTAADYVLHLDPWWNPAIEAQATDRVHRMGQTQKVIVYKFLCKGTIEEKIQDLQDTKRQLLVEMVDTDDKTPKSLDINELTKLLD